MDWGMTPAGWASHSTVPRFWDQIQLISHKLALLTSRASYVRFATGGALRTQLNKSGHSETTELAT